MQEKKLLPKKVASVEAVENLLVKLDKLAWDIEDDAIKSELFATIENICSVREICTQCYVKIDEVWFDEGLERNCNCKPKKISA